MVNPVVSDQNPTAEQPLWAPDTARVKQTTLWDFMAQLTEKTGATFADYDALWHWSLANREMFWEACWDYCGIIGTKGETIIARPDQMPGADFFPQARLNYAENCLKRRDKAPALIFCNEKGQERILSFADLYEQVSLWQQALKAEGVKEGDRVAAYMPNMPETIIAMLATVSLGAVWSSASPDFGSQGVLDRFGQIEPTILVAVEGYYYNGKEIDCLEKLRAIQPHLPSVRKTVLVPFFDPAETDRLAAKAETLPQETVTVAAFTKDFSPEEISFTAVSFDHPLFIMFSSGTTGAPKCIIHGHGGTLIQHLKEHQLHCDIKKDDRVFYFTTCGWMMWNWLVTALASEATLLLYDGSPFYPDGYVLWDFTSRHNCTLFGTAAKFIDALKSHELRPGEKYDLSALRAITSTGSPLVHESFDYVYDHIKEDVHLASISGGTDIISCFVLGNPISPVWRGEIQCAGLGMAVDAYDEKGHSLTQEGGAGELVCTKPFPSMPVGFWNDPDNLRYRAAYFERFPGIWHHGDWIEKTVRGGYIIHGRSDATLNPGGVRIGTAEIYRQVEQVQEVQESLVIGQNWKGDTRIILFVMLWPDYSLDEELIQKIRKKIRSGASPRHVPAKVIQVADIPRTKSNKITELAVRDIIHGKEVKNVEALANPEALDLFRDIAELSKD